LLYLKPVLMFWWYLKQAKSDETLYDQKAVELAQKLKANFAKFEEFANSETMGSTESIS
jgi:hypothetical protein